MQNQYNYLTNPMIAQLAEIKRKRDARKASMQNALQPRQGKGAGLAQLLAVLGTGISNKMKPDLNPQEQAIMEYSKANQQADQDIITGASSREDLMRILLGSPNPQNQKIGTSMLAQPPAKPVDKFVDGTMMIPDGKGGLKKVAIKRNTTTNEPTILGGGQTINVGNETNEGTKVLQKNMAKQYVEDKKTYFNLKNQNHLLDQVALALSKGSATGLGEEALMQLKQVGQFFGVDTDTSGQELIRAVQNQMAMLIRNPDSGGGLPGSASNRDVAFLKAAVAGLDKSEEANMMLINMTKKMNQFRIDFHEYQAQLIADNKGAFPADFDIKSAAFMESYELLSEDDKSQITNFLKGARTRQDQATFGTDVPLRDATPDVNSIVEKYRTR